jgi:hypothetical protein
MTSSGLLRSSRYAASGAPEGEALGWVTALGAGDTLCAGDVVGVALAPEPALGAGPHATVNSATRIATVVARLCFFISYELLQPIVGFLLRLVPGQH